MIDYYTGNNLNDYLLNRGLSTLETVKECIEAKLLIEEDIKSISKIISQNDSDCRKLVAKLCKDKNVKEYVLQYNYDILNPDFIQYVDRDSEIEISIINYTYHKCFKDITSLRWIHYCMDDVIQRVRIKTNPEYIDERFSFMLEAQKSKRGPYTKIINKNVRKMFNNRW